MASNRDAQLLARVRELVASACADLEVAILDIELKGQAQKRVIRIVADVADPDASDGLDVDEIAAISRNVSAVFDDVDAVPGSYTLEVTSPGIDRPLRTERDFRRNVGRSVSVRTLDGEQRTGEIVRADATSVVLALDTEQVMVALDNIDMAKVVLPW